MTSVEQADALFAVYNDKAAAKFEELYAAAGEPSELDETFVNGYFTAIIALQTELGVTEAEPTIFAPHSTNANFAKTNSDVTTVDIPDKNRRFRVSNVTSIMKLPGKSQTFGHAEGTYTFEVEQWKGGFVRIVMKDTKSIWKRVEYLSHSVRRIQAERGKGVWENM